MDFSYRVYQFHSVQMVYSTRDFHSLGSSLLRKKGKAQSSYEVMTMSRKCEKLHLRFWWKNRVSSKQTQALFSKNKLPVWINPWTIQQLVNCASYKKSSGKVQTETLNNIQRWTDCKIKKYKI